MTMDMFKRVPVREQDPKVRATNFNEVCLGYNKEEAEAEAQRCLNCKKPFCVEGCPVGVNIPSFIKNIERGNILGAAVGYDAIPQHFKDDVELHDVILRVADELYNAEV